MTHVLPRRTVAKATVAAACGCALAACSGGGRGPKEPAAPADPTKPLAQLADLPVGAPMPATDSNGRPVLLVRTSETEVTGLSAICPHTGCTVRPRDQLLVCPCHGSRFDAAGKLQQGPAEEDLATFPVRVADGTVLPA